MICLDSIAPTYLIFSNSVPSLLYYSHIPPVLLAFLLCCLIIKNGLHAKSLSLKIIIFLLIDFIVLALTNLIIWTNIDINTVIISWVINQLAYILLPVLTLLFYSSFSKKKEELSIIYKTVIVIIVGLFVPMIVSRQNLEVFNLADCVISESPLFYYYQNFVVISSILWIILSSVRDYFNKNLLKIFRIQIVIISIGLVLLLLTLFSSWNSEMFNYSYEIEQFGFIGMIIFIALISYCIVKFNTFSIKLLGAQALMWTIALLVGSQLFFIKTTQNFILTGITLFIITGAGFVLVRSVKKEIALREQLEIANNNQAALIHFISHQIKGFFTKSKMIFSGLLEGDFGEMSEIVKEVAQTGLDSDNNAVAMVQDILKASNFKTGITDYTYQKIDLVGIVKEVAESFQDDMEKKSLAYHIEVPDTIVPSLADETQITQVFKNLIDNSLKYTPSGEINVSLKEDKASKKIWFVVSDTGVGLSEADKKKLFTEGGKGEESLRVNTNSTGYGLYIVKKIVEAHKGHILAESAGRGFGSKFTVELKLAE